MKKISPPEPPDLAEGFWWYKNFIFLKSGGYNHEWRIARVSQGMIQPLGMQPLEPDCRYLQNALWHGPIVPPPLEEPSRIALALAQSGSRQKRKNRRAASSAGEPTPGPQALAVAEDIVDSLVNMAEPLTAHYHDHPQDRDALVERVAELLERTFVSRSLVEEP